MRRKDKRNLLLVHSELMDGKFKVGRSAFTLQSCKIYFICKTTSPWGGGLMLRKDEFYVYCKIVHWYNYLIITDNKITHWGNTEKKLECWFMSVWYSDLNLPLAPISISDFKLNSIAVILKQINASITVFSSIL